MGNGLTGAALRAEVPEHDDGLLALLDFALLYRLDEGVFGIERSCLPSKL